MNEIITIIVLILLLFITLSSRNNNGKKEKLIKCKKEVQQLRQKLDQLTSQ